MKKAYLLIITVIAGLTVFGQSVPNNVDVGLSANGTNGSNASSGGYIAVSLRIKPGGVSYAPSPTAQDFVVYLIAPKSDFDASDLTVVTEVNSAMYGSATVTLMQDQGNSDLGPFDPANLYYVIALNSGIGMNISSLSAATNAWVFAFSFKFNNPKTSASFNKIKIVDQNNNTALNAATGQNLFTNLIMGVTNDNQLTTGAFSTLPVNFLNFSGYKNGVKNSLQWTTASESHNLGFDVMRSTDGVNYNSIGFVNSHAPGGTSTSELNYTFDDMNPAGRKQYYQLRQKDIDGRSRLSNIITISGDKPTSLGIGGLYPNPASSTVNVIVDAPQRDDITVVITDMSGKTVKQKQANVDIGSNTVPVEIGNLSSGSYLVKLICRSSDCQIATAKFNKQ
jgi:Secretion system C-terminal sorting domain